MILAATMFFQMYVLPRQLKIFDSYWRWYCQLSRIGSGTIRWCRRDDCDNVTIGGLVEAVFSWLFDWNIW
jgi:hypothetical protein